MSLRSTIFAALVIGLVATLLPPPAMAEDAATIEKNSREALAMLLEESEGAKGLADDAVAILVFPEILKGGLIVGGLYGEGALMRDDKVDGFYSTAAGSIGLQAGVQTYGYAMIFLEEEAMQYLDNADGWEVGSAPNIVVFDPELAASGKLSTASARGNTYVFFFNQKGLMAGLGIEGTKISSIERE